MTSLDNGPRMPSGAPAPATHPLEHTIVELDRLRPDLLACGFELGELELELSTTPTVAIGVTRTHGDAEGLASLVQRADLTSAQRGLAGAMLRAYEMEEVVLRTGHRMGAMRVKLGLPPVMTIALTQTGEPPRRNVSEPAPTAPDPGPTMPEARAGEPSQPPGADALPPPPSVKPPPPPPPRSARLSDRAPPPPKMGVPTQIGYGMPAAAGDALPPPPPRPAAVRPSTRPAAAVQAFVPPPPAQPAAPVAAAQPAMPSPLEPPAVSSATEPDSQPPPVLAPEPSVENPGRLAPTQHDGMLAVEQPSAATNPDPAPPSAFAIDSWVYVTWTDGNRYPGRVRSTSSDQVLVEFEDAAQHWVHESYVAPA